MRNHESRMIQLQRETILDVLHEPGRPWMQTDIVARATPWAALTCQRRLLALLDDGLVERSKTKPSHSWRLK